MTRREHWEAIYRSKSASTVSWYQAEPQVSMTLIRRVAIDLDSAIIDVGGGASVLVDGLLDAGYRHVTVLDIAEPALTIVRRRLGERAESVEWLEADVLTAQLPAAKYAVWHDRAVFHFLTGREERRSYVAALRHAVKPRGHAIVSSFATDGPSRCSGLEVVRYSPESMHAELGEGFELIDSVREDHRTPSGATQSFVYCLFRLASI
jgi:2-polyprenyl-3-methyl-5-hydroxy-6-metoxy-1,4-benzoquinol methylase